MAALRRLAVKEHKKNSEHTRLISPVSIISKLTRYQEQAAMGVNLICWVDNGDDEMACRAWFRTGCCLRKKCKLSHGDTLAPATDVPFDPSDDPAETSMHSAAMEEIPLTQADDLRLIILDNHCVYDYEKPSLWLDYIASPHSIFRRKMSFDSCKLEVIEEELHEASEAPRSPRGNAAMSTLRWFKSCSSFDCILSFLPLKDVVQVMMACKELKSLVQKDASSRRRIKETADTLAAELSKKKHSEKKKKIKNAFVKATDKKDEFARGGRA